MRATPQTVTRSLLKCESYRDAHSFQSEFRFTNAVPQMCRSCRVESCTKPDSYFTFCSISARIWERIRVIRGRKLGESCLESKEQLSLFVEFCGLNLLCECICS